MKFVGRNLLEQLQSTGSSGGKKLGFKCCECRIAIVDDGLFVANEMIDAGSACQFAHEFGQENKTLRVCAQIDAGNARRNAHHGEACKLQKVDAARSEVGRDTLGNVVRDEVLFPKSKCVAAEKSIL